MDASHTGVRPAGRLRATQGTTNAAGVFQTTYTPSHIGEVVTITAAIGQVRLDVQLTVAVPGLAELGDGVNYVLIGFDNPYHPQGTNHWGTSQADVGLIQIADDYRDKYYAPNPIPDDKKLRYNDQSLPLGGKFDLAHHWAATGAHAEHREGINADVRCCGGDGAVPTDRWAELNEIFIRRGSTNTLDETETDMPHWHLRFEFGGQQAAITRNTGNFVDATWWGALDREATDNEWQDKTNRLTTAQAQGQSPTLDEARALERTLFQSPEYINRNRSDQEYVTDLYQAYLLRDPDSGGYNAWLSVLQNDNAQGLNGREHLLQGFEYSQEFANLIGGLEMMPTPDPPPTSCDPVQEQNCYNAGGSWDSATCTCIYEPPPDPCYGPSGSRPICQ